MPGNKLNNRLENLMRVFNTPGNEEVNEKERVGILRDFQNFIINKNVYVQGTCDEIKNDLNKFEVLSKMYLIHRFSETNSLSEEKVNELKANGLILDFSRKEEIAKFLREKDINDENGIRKTVADKYAYFLRKNQEFKQFLDQEALIIKDRLQTAKAGTAKTHDLIRYGADGIINRIMPNINQQVTHLGYQGHEGLLAVIGYEAFTKLLEAMLAIATGSFDKFKVDLVKNAEAKSPEETQKEKQQIERAIASVPKVKVPLA